MIYFKKANTKEGIEGLLDSLFSYDRIGWKCAVDTYRDKKCKVLQCHPARRSLPDLEKIVETYFPNTYSRADIVKHILITAKGCAFPCDDINKWVFMYDSNAHSNEEVRGLCDSDHKDKDGVSRELIVELLNS